MQGYELFFMIPAMFFYVILYDSHNIRWLNCRKSLGTSLGFQWLLTKMQKSENLYSYNVQKSVFLSPNMRKIVNVGCLS